MRKCRFIAAVALLVLPSILVSSPGYSASQLPWINTGAGPVQQPFCPNGSQYGCFGPNIQTGGQRAAVAGYSNSATYPFTPFEPCLQFMQAFLRMAASATQSSVTPR